MGAEKLFLEQEVQDKPGRFEPSISATVLHRVFGHILQRSGERVLRGPDLSPSRNWEYRAQDLGCGISLGFGMQQSRSSWGSGETRRGDEHQGWSGPCEIRGSWIKHPANSAWGGLAVTAFPSLGVLLPDLNFSR